VGAAGGLDSDEVGATGGLDPGGVGAGAAGGLDSGEVGAGEPGATGTTVEVTVVGGGLGEEDGGDEEIMVVGQVVTVVTVRVWVRVTGLVITDDPEDIVV